MSVQAVYGINLTSEERVALVQQVPPSLVHDLLALLKRQALYEQLPPEQRVSARQRPYPPQVPAAVVQATRHEKQQTCLFRLHQDASHRQQSTPMPMRPSKTDKVHQAHVKLAGLDLKRVGIWVRGLSRLATIEEVRTWHPEWCASTVVYS